MSAPTPFDPIKAGLGAVLFGKGDVPLYAVLDGASAPKLVKKLYEHEPEYCCLQRGELALDMAVVASYLVRLEPETPFTEHVLAEGWGAHWGMFLTSPANLRALRNHFREFLRVETPDNREIIFRFYDPRVLRTFLPACNAEELRSFFGPVQTFIVEGATPEAGMKFSLAGAALKPEPFQLKKPA
jgi:hypothetical protein